MTTFKHFTRSLIVLLSCGLIHAAEQPPNIVLILVDDMPYNALSYTGNEHVETPNIDKICERGVFCTEAYVTHGVCAPSRAGLMTGRYQARFGYETLSGPTEHAIAQDHGVDVNEITIADILKKAGYQSAALGKWHLGVNEKYQPLQRGFNHQYGFAGGGGPYYVKPNKPHTLIRNGAPAEWPDGAYQTDLLAKEAVDWMNQVSKESPFFLYFAPYAVHGPFEAPAELIPPGKHAMVGMVKSLDLAVGRILSTLEELKISDNTLIIFTNDNGGVPKLFEHGFTNEPYRGGKASVLDGGLHIPFAWYWPGKVEGDQYKGIISTLDILPTLAHLAGVELPKDREFDGKNILSNLTGNVAPDHSRSLCWRWRNGHAIRKGKWKLVWELNWGEFHRLRKKQNTNKISPTARPNPRDRYSSLYFEPQLFDLNNDPAENKNLATQFPELVEELKKDLLAFDALGKPLTQEELNAWPKPE